MKSKKYWIPILFIVFGLFLVACGCGKQGGGDCGDQSGRRMPTMPPRAKW